MGFTPTAGLVMGTRPGDLDPRLLTYLTRRHGMCPEELEQVLYRESGLTALAGTGDVRQLLGREGSDPAAALALEVYCRRVAQGLAAVAVTLGGLDTLIFTGGIGENSPEVRDRVRSRLAFLGDGLRVRAMATDEEAVMARHAADLLRR